MKRSRRTEWLPCLGLVILLGSCKGDGADKPAADPLDDPWIDAIDTGDEQPVAAGPELPPSTEPSADDSEVAGLAMQAQPAAVLATPPPSELAGEPRPEPAGASARAPASDTPSTPAAEPEQPAPEAPVSDEPATEPAEPTKVPSAEPAAPASPPPITSADFHGSYRYAGGSSQRAELDAAIENTVTQLSRAIQGIARKRLTEVNPVDGSVQITVVGDKITTSFASGFQVSCTIDGPSVDTKGLGGEKLSVQVRTKGSKLVQHMQGRDGARTIVFSLSADRKTLSVHHKITADRLPEPLTYRLSYARK